MAEQATTTSVLLIAGMHCNRCRELVEAALGAVAGVRQVHVNLFRAVATAQHRRDLDPAALVRAVEKSGYHATIKPLPAPRPEKHPDSRPGTGSRNPGPQETPS